MVKKASMCMISAVVFWVGAASGASLETTSNGQVTRYAKGQYNAGEHYREQSVNRFTNPDGTTPVSGDVVLDRLTGLIWTKDGKTPGPTTCSPAESKTWQSAHDYVVCLNAAGYLGYSDWRLSSVQELKSLVNGNQRNSAEWLNKQGFNDVQASYYWSSSVDEVQKSNAMCVGMAVGGVYAGPKAYDTFFAWPVRSGQ